MSEADAANPEPDRWEVPAIEQTGGGLVTAGSLEALQKEAYDEAFARGREAGLEAGRTELSERVARLDALLKAQARPLADVDETVVMQLVDLSMRVVRKLFRRELQQDPGHVVGVVREAIGLLPVASRDVSVRLHPDDAALVREALPEAEGDKAWSLVEDPLIERGGCRVFSETSQIDAENATRLDSLIASIINDEREAREE